jgi:hypothetical protein
MGMGPFKDLVVPALKANMDARQWAMSQNNENQRSANQINAENTRSALSRNAEQGRAISGVAEKNAPILNASAQLSTALTAMDNLNSDPNNKSIPFTGDLGAKYAQMNPNTTSKWVLNQKAADGWANVGAGAIEKMVEGRYNDQQMARIKQSLFPTGNELGTPVGNLKIQQLRSYVQQAKAGALGQVTQSLDAIAGAGTNLPAMANPVTSPQTPAGLMGQGNQPQGASGPYGPTVVRNNKTYVWSPISRMYHAQQ